MLVVEIESLARSSHVKLGLVCLRAQMVGSNLLGSALTLGVLI